MDFSFSISSLIWIFLTTYFMGGFLIFAFRSVAYGDYYDPEIAEKGSSALLIAYIRNYFAWLIQPVIKLLIWSGVSPNGITGFSVVLAAAAGWYAAQGRFASAGWLYVFSGICDFLDGRVARATNRVTVSGSVLDSILDRYSESALLIGLLWYYRHGWELLVFLLFLTGSFLVPYIRARSEVLGIAGKVGLMQRPERLVLLGVAMLVSDLWYFGYPSYAASSIKHPLVVGIGLMLAVFTQVTAAYRLRHLLRSLEQREAAAELVETPTTVEAIRITIIESEEVGCQ